MGKKVETMTDLIFLGCRITVDGDCGHEIKRHTLFGRIAMTNLVSTLKNQRYYFADKGPYSQAMVFPIVMSECESSVINKAEWQ